MVNLSQPMTFQTALAALDAVENRSTSMQQSSSSRSALAESTKQSSKARNGTSSKSRHTSKEDDDFAFDDEGKPSVAFRAFTLEAHTCAQTEYDSSDSFCLVPSSSDTANETARLKKENTSLKNQLEAMEKQMTSVKKQISIRNEQDQQLRDNIILARKEVCPMLSLSSIDRLLNSHI